MLYLMAALRDGSRDNRIGKNYEIKIGQKDTRWLTEVLKPLIERNFRCNANVHGNLLRITNKKIVREIQELSGIKSWGWRTPAGVKKIPVSARIPYMKGFWDAEGGMPKVPEKCTRAEQRYISFHQKGREPLAFVRQTLLHLHYIPTRITFCKGAHEFG